MATFEEFRASFPDDNNEKGDLFEKALVDWILKKHPYFETKFKKVWHFKDWRGKWSGKDLGTDIIAEDYDGKRCAIQAKFYAENREIVKKDIDSFIADAGRPEIDYLYLIATTNKINKNARTTIAGQQKEVHEFLLDKFDDPRMAWPKSVYDLKAPPRKPYQPYPYQKQAIDAVVSKLGERGQLIMACGTGKTLTGQRINERLKSKSTLILFPSLLLLSKTMKDWLFDKETDFAFLPVCSDKTVKREADSAEISTRELGCPSTTDPVAIADFLRKRGNKVIFSTYQSSPQIAEAVKQQKLPKFDLIIADEAHRCAGKVSSDYATVLDDALIPAKRRLFMTATPRVYQSQFKKRAANEDIALASMDDEAVFGPELHRLSFGTAIEQKLLSDYQVLVVGVNDAMVNEMVRDQILVETGTGLKGDARSLAIQIGLAKAIKKYDLKRIISFHSRVNLAKNFAQDFHQVLEFLRPKDRPKGKLTYDYVSGVMPTADRNTRLKSLGLLEEEDRYVLANARCLSEGVDVPTLDGVAFVDPRRSEIDIVQAVGRAIRLDKTNENKIGTIVIPVFIEDGDDPDNKISASEFDQVWKVVTALRSHDEVLSEELDELRVQMGRKKKISIKGTKIILDLHKSIDQSFARAFETKLVEATTASWEFWFGLLTTYIEQMGDTKVQRRTLFEGYDLARWVSKQRVLYKNGLLQPDRRARLDEIDFIWDANFEAWEHGFESLVAYKKKFGDCLVPSKQGFTTTDGGDLHSWVRNQRAAYLRKELSSERIKRLENLGFVWDVIEEQWQEGFQALKEFQERFGHCRVSKSKGHKTKSGNDLGHWCLGNRKLFKDGKLSKDHYDRLQALGFVWDQAAWYWDAAYEALKKYSEKTGHCVVPRGNKYKTEDGRDLNAWCGTQRYDFSKGKLDRKRIKLLEEIGFIFDPNLESWEKGFEGLKKYKFEFGNCAVPAGKKFLLEDGSGLGVWCDEQRTQYKKGRLSQDRETRLNKLGFIWDIPLWQWEQGFEALKRFKLKYGHCRVTKNLDLETSLGTNLSNWVFKQRKNREKKRLDAEKFSRLERLGFIWDPHQLLWDEGIEALLEFKKREGHCWVPKKKGILTASGKDLGVWCEGKRIQKRKAVLSSERVRQLNDLGFPWEPLQGQWEMAFEALLKFKKRNGHCNVTRRSNEKLADGRSLGGWVQEQRTRFKRNIMPNEQYARLDEIGFDWGNATD